MNNIVRTTLLGAMLLIGASAFAEDFSIGIRIGAPPRPRVVKVVPRQPGPDYIWVQGYWYPVNGRYKWADGYWTRPPYAGARWVQPRYEGGQFYAGFWDGDRGRFGHDHRWDKDRNHDGDRWHGDDHDHR